MDNLDHIENILQILLALMPLLGLAADDFLIFNIYRRIDLKDELKTEIYNRFNYLAIILTTSFGILQNICVLVAYIGGTFSGSLVYAVMIAALICTIVYLIQLGPSGYKRSSVTKKTIISITPVLLAVLKYILMAFLSESQEIAEPKPPPPMSQMQTWVDDERRYWVDYEGRQLHAKLRVVSEFAIVLEDTEGRLRVVRLDRLSERDRKEVQNRFLRTPEEKIAPSSNSPVEAMHQDAPGKPVSEK